MTVIYLLVPLAMLLAGLAVAAFVWSARKGQLDDLVTPALRMLHDDDDIASNSRPRRADASPGTERDRNSSGSAAPSSDRE